MLRDQVHVRVQSARSRLDDAATHLAGGGKGIRRQCVYLVGRALRTDGSADAALAVLADALEFLHLGTLIHDDILDEAVTRRGRNAVHVDHGTKVAVLAGDHLLSQASRLIASLDQPSLCRHFSDVLADLCEGELLQDQHRWDTGVTLEDYFARIAKKTSGPFELACEGAAVLAGAEPAVHSAMRRLGFHVGRLFQMVDDLLDVAGQSAAIGKPTGQDLAAGTLTLPTLVALADPDLGPALRFRLARGAAGTPGSPGAEAAPTRNAAGPLAHAPLAHDPLAIARHPRVRHRCAEMLQAETSAALEAIGHLPAGPDRRKLEDLCRRLASAPGAELSVAGHL